MEKISTYSSDTANSKNIERLSIVDSVDSLYLFMYDSALRCVGYEKVSKKDTNLKSWLQNTRNRYGDIDYRLYYSGPDYEILPRELFHYGNEKVYLRNLTPLAAKGMINFTDKCAEEKLVVIYPVSASLDITMRESIRGVHTFHLASSILKSNKIEDNVLHCVLLAEVVFFAIKTEGRWIANYAKHRQPDLSAMLISQYTLYQDQVKNIKIHGDFTIEEFHQLQEAVKYVGEESYPFCNSSNTLTL